jgi:hypothetical protein
MLTEEHGSVCISAEGSIGEVYPSWSWEGGGGLELILQLNRSSTETLHHYIAIPNSKKGRRTLVHI